MRKTTMLRALAAAGLADAPSPITNANRTYQSAPGINSDIPWQDLDWDGWRSERDRNALASLTERSRRPREAPTHWTPDLVGKRLVEALKTLRRIPARIGPKGYGSTMPEIIRDWADKLAQLENPDNSMLHTTRARSTPTADEVARMDEALSWPLRFLQGDELAAHLVVAWAQERAKGAPRDPQGKSGRRDSPAQKSLETAFRRFASSPSVPGADDLSPSDRAELLSMVDDATWSEVRVRLQRKRIRALTHCAACLNRAGVPVA